MNPKLYSPGHYEKWPYVTWDLAQERWEQSRRQGYLAYCLSCGLIQMDNSLGRSERMAEVEALVVARHWYECPSGSSCIAFAWLGPADRQVRLELGGHGVSVSVNNERKRDGWKKAHSIRRRLD